MSRRLLLASYHFGHGCETGGLRWNAMTSHLVGAGWEVDVLSAARPGADRPYLFGPGVRVTPVEVPTGLGDTVRAMGRLKRRLMALAGSGEGDVDRAAPADDSPARPGPGHRLYSRLMGNLTAAGRWSAELGWSRGAVRSGLALARSRSPSVVAVSTPPHPTHLAGVRLAGVLGVPLVADFRDPWVFGELDAVQSTLIDLKRGARAQARTFEAAARLVLNTPWAAEAALAHDPRLAGRTAVIPNGYDPHPGIGRPDPGLFRVAFVGWLYEFMDPEPVLAACGRLRQREQLQELRVEFVGTDSAPGGVSLLARARAHGLEAHFEHRRRVPREEALRAQESAAVQVVFDYPGPYRIPMKFYDAVQAYGDLLLVGRPKSALADAAARVGFSVCPPGDAEAIDAALARALARWRARDYRAPVDVHGLFARERTSDQMLQLIETLAAAPGGGPAA